MSLWRLDNAVGTYRLERNVTPETAGAWLEIFQRDAPSATFVVSCVKPKTTVEKELRKRARERKARDKAQRG